MNGRAQPLEIPGVLLAEASGPADGKEPAMPPGNGLLALTPGDLSSAAFDLEAAERAAAALLAALGVPAGSEAALRTPARMVAGLVELLSAPAWEFTTFPNTESQHELVLARNVPFTSVCAHHLLPFSGVAQVGVLPGERIAGLSKLARAVEAFAARMQVQEELGQQVASFLESRLECRGVGVVLEAEHLCMTRRGDQGSGMRHRDGRHARAAARRPVRAGGVPAPGAGPAAVGGMSYAIGKRFSFEAGHRLGGLPEGHKCARPHGHSYTVEVIVTASDLTGPGFVTDFADLDPLRRHLAEAYDHRMLNDVIDPEPTSENLARVLFDWCAANLALPSAAVAAVRVSETSATWAEYRPEPVL